MTCKARTASGMASPANGRETSYYHYHQRNHYHQHQETWRDNWITHQKYSRCLPGGEAGHAAGPGCPALSRRAALSAISATGRQR
jgi:hypothetical protein